MPKKPALKKQDEVVNFIVLSSAAIITVLSLLIISSYFSDSKEPSEVLGTQTTLEVERQKLESFLDENPTYYPGWVELARIEAETGNIEVSNQAKQKAWDISPLIEDY